ncbi:AraC family transcriptional regulator [Pedobacter arcticus]|uniref:AraC family transcriptional regulator n=1 Tax=Pedobacter arcticus TaxID=752140 RepID=UPI0002E4CCC9|nr:AraC family transcriptional regulator [Pedobacter arcticus]
MKPVLMRHTEIVEQSFKVWENSNPYIHNPWHYHPECEITYIENAQGTLIIGDKAIDYTSDSLIFIGSNLPHEFRGINKETPDLKSKSYSVHFQKNFPGKDFYKMPELAVINQLFDISARGIKIHDQKSKDLAKKYLLKLFKSEGVERVGHLLKLLNIISLSPKLEILSSQIFGQSPELPQNQRINQVCKYVMDNFRNEITIEQLVTHFHMTPTSFSRFFKKRTNKSFTQYVNEIRIGYACKLMFQENFSISQIAFECGFGNLSNFNQQFKKIKLITPSQFIAQLSKKDVL